MYFSIRFFFCASALLGSSVVHAKQQQLRSTASPQDDSTITHHHHTNGRRLKMQVVKAKGLIEIIDQDFSDSLVVNNNGKGHVLTFNVGKGHRAIQIKTNVQDQEVEVRLLGRNKKNVLTDEDRNFLVAVGDSLEADGSIDTDTVDSPTFQAHRMARLLRDWPETMDIDFEFDKEKEMDRMEKREKEGQEHPIPSDAPSIPGEDRKLMGTNKISPGSLVTKDSQGRRRLAYTTLCDKLYTYVATTHDDWNYNRWDDQTTYNAYVAPSPACNIGDGTNFWVSSSWQCFEPDHDANIEYAYGQCFGRCGAGCGLGGGGSGTYTYDCLDHDSCVRFGHSLASFWCNDEFATTVDDYALAPNCI